MSAGSPLLFTADDVGLYVEVSGDRNPLHVDDGFARRSAFGQRIVHGALVATGLLGRLPVEARRSVRAVRVAFAGPVLVGVGHAAVTEQRRDGPWPWEVRLIGRGKTLARLSASESAESPAVRAGAAPGRRMRDQAATCSASSLEQGHAISGAYAARRLGDLATRFGVDDVDPSLLAGLACASYVVGMEAPGLHGLLAAIELRLCVDGGITGYDLTVDEVDDRTGRVVLAGVLVSSNSARAGVRIEAFAQESTEAAQGPPLTPVPRRDERVVVIGASRGLGAAITLDLLGRGYDVHAVYAESASAAHELEQRAAGAAERLLLHQANAADAGAMASLAEAIERSGQPLTGVVLNAAPPPLGMGLTADAADDLVAYVGTSVRVVATPLGALLPLVGEGGWLAFCSSAAMSKPPRDWPQYVAAKGAIEALASWAASIRPELKTVVVRPPKLSTDLSNTPAGRIGAADPSEIARSLVEHLDTAAAGLTTLCP